MGFLKGLKDVITGQSYVEQQERHVRHERNMATLAALDVQLAIKSNNEYQDNRDKIKDCPKCKVQPTHIFDPKGMPMDTLRCPKCGKSFSLCKDFKRVVTSWNAGERNEYYDLYST